MNSTHKLTEINDYTATPVFSLEQIAAILPDIPSGWYQLRHLEWFSALRVLYHHPLPVCPNFTPTVIYTARTIDSPRTTTIEHVATLIEYTLTRGVRWISLAAANTSTRAGHQLDIDGTHTIKTNRIHTTSRHHIIQEGNRYSLFGSSTTYPLEESEDSAKELARISKKMYWLTDEKFWESK